MRTDARVRIVLGAILTVALASAPAMAQVRVDAATQVRSIHFEGVHTLSEASLRRVLQTKDRGSSYGLRAALGKLPVIDKPSPHPFSPIELQRDVVRLRRTYIGAGFTRVQVRYDVTRDDKDNLLDITFVIDEGAPVLVDGVTITGPDSLAPLVAPAAEQHSWEHAQGAAKKISGKRLDLTEARAQRTRLENWWRDRGYPGAVVGGRIDVDSLRMAGRIDYLVRPGARRLVGDIRVTGNESISANVVTRQLPFRTGDVYSAAEFQEGRLDVQALEIIRIARLETSPGTAGDSAKVSAPADSVLPVTVRITEAKPRLVSGEVGYVTDGGVSSEARWSHRNFLGDARTITCSALAQTGLWSLSNNPDIRYRGTVSMQQPYFLHRRLSLLESPFVEYRDDSQDRSTQYGTNTTFVYRLNRHVSGSLDYRIASRHIDEYNLEELAAGDIDLLTFLTQLSQGQLDSLGTNLLSSVFSLSANASSVDDITNPHRGFIVRPAIQATAPQSWSSTSYWRLDGVAYAFAPLSRRAGFTGRVSAGRLYPFGKSIPGEGESGTVNFLQLRDVTFTAGGSGDVRGWDTRLLGPKFPDVRFQPSGDSTIAVADGYVALGGFQRVSFSLELRTPLPWLGPNFGLHAFLDGGRVWTSDQRYRDGGDPLGQEKFFYATGAGLDLTTPVGPIRMSLGYKLNPSIVDLVDSADLFAAGTSGTPISDLHQHNSHRWQFNLAIGSSF